MGLLYQHFNTISDIYEITVIEALFQESLKCGLLGAMSKKCDCNMLFDRFRCCKKLDSSDSPICRRWTIWRILKKVVNLALAAMHMKILENPPKSVESYKYLFVSNESISDTPTQWQYFKCLDNYWEVTPWFVHHIPCSVIEFPIFKFFMDRKYVLFERRYSEENRYISTSAHREPFVGKIFAKRNSLLWIIFILSCCSCPKLVLQGLFLN